MNTQNVNTAAAESTETRFNGDKIRVIVTPDAKAIFNGEMSGLERYGREQMEPGCRGNPFGPWRFERVQG